MDEGMHTSQDHWHGDQADIGGHQNFLKYGTEDTILERMYW
jgi:hypothetical protein